MSPAIPKPIGLKPQPPTQRRRASTDPAWPQDVADYLHDTDLWLQACDSTLRLVERLEREAIKVLEMIDEPSTLREDVVAQVKVLLQDMVLLRANPGGRIENVLVAADGSSLAAGQAGLGARIERALYAEDDEELRRQMNLLIARLRGAGSDLVKRREEIEGQRAKVAMRFSDDR